MQGIGTQSSHNVFAREKLHDEWVAVCENGEGSQSGRSVQCFGQNALSSTLSLRCGGQKCAIAVGKQICVCRLSTALYVSNAATV